MVLVEFYFISSYLTKFILISAKDEAKQTKTAQTQKALGKRT